MTKEEFDQMMDIGKSTFGIIGADLNELSKKYIRTDEEQFRREVDFLEMCLALAIFERYFISHFPQSEYGQHMP